MVLAPIIGIGLLALAFFFRNELGAFIKGFQAQQAFGEDPVGFTTSSAGSFIEETFGEQALKNLTSNLTLDPSIAQKQLEDLLAQGEKNLASNITGIQTKVIDPIVAGANQTLVDVQKNLEQFAKDSQQNITNAQNLIDTTFEKAGTDITNFFSPITDFFNSFGGQSQTKEITKTIDVNQTQEIKTQQGGTIDLSFLTPVESIEGQGSLLEMEAEKDRFGGTGSLR